jgi:hypothetical protein
VQAQSSGSVTPSVPPSVFGDDPFDRIDRPAQDPALLQAMRKQERALNTERQKTIVKDTALLGKLVSDLNAEINGREQSPLTAEQMQKLAEIEKLAHAIRDKMSTPIRLPGPSAEPGLFHHRYQ